MFFLRIQLISLFPAPRRPRLFSPSSHHRNANLIRKEEERGDGIIIECRLPPRLLFSIDQEHPLLLQETLGACFKNSTSFQVSLSSKRLNSSK